MSSLARWKLSLIIASCSLAGSSVLAVDSEFDLPNCLELSTQALRRGDTSSAIKLLEQAARMRPTNETVRNQLAQAYTKEGQLLSERGESESGLTFLERALDLKPTSSEALDLLQSAWEDALKRDPRVADFHIGLGRCLAQRGDFGGARGEYRQAISLSPGESSGAKKLAMEIAEFQKLVRRIPCTEHILDDLFLYPDGSQKFDPGRWKADVSSRSTMIFDFYHQNWKHRSKNQIYEELGAPDRIQKQRESDTQLFYDLGLLDGFQTFLVLDFEKGVLCSLSLEQEIKRAYICSPWQLTNMAWETLAKDCNKKYRLIGLPVKLLPSALCHFSDTGAKTLDGVTVHCFGPFQIEFTGDNSTVKQFRLEYKPSKNTVKFTPWESEDLRGNSACLSTKDDYDKLNRLPYERPGDAFSDLVFSNPFHKDDWYGQRNKWWFIMGLARSYPLVGMTRNEIKSLLGPSNSDSLRKLVAERGYALPQTVDSNFADTEKYQLWASTCLNAPVGYLQFAYQDDRVVAYRMVYDPGFDTTVLTSQTFK